MPERLSCRRKDTYGALPREELDPVLSELTKAFQPISPPRAGAIDLLAEVIRLLPERRSWQVENERRRI